MSSATPSVADIREILLEDQYVDQRIRQLEIALVGSTDLTSQARRTGESLYNLLTDILHKWICTKYESVEKLVELLRKEQFEYVACKLKYIIVHIILTHFSFDSLILYGQHLLFRQN